MKVMKAGVAFVCTPAYPWRLHILNIGIYLNIVVIF